MLDEQDKKEIGGIINNAIDKLARDIVLPGFQNVESRLDSMETNVKEVKRTLTTMPDRDDLDRAVAEIKGVMNEKLRQQQTQMHLLISFLKEENILKDHHIKKLKELDLFPGMH